MPSSDDKPKVDRSRKIRHKPDPVAAAQQNRTHLLTDYEAMRLLRLFQARLDREMEALRLYEPVPHQLAFHQSPALERLAIGSNRSGKTTAVSCEISWAATGQHPYLDYPKGPMEIYLVAKDGRQIGEVWWRKLTDFAFYMIRDEQTKRWRAFKPGQAYDEAYIEKRKPAPPLIPQRFWQGKPVWEAAGLGIPKLLHLKNGSRIHFFTGNAKPPQGTAIHLAAFSEELGSQIWYPEIAVRLAQHNGKFIWDATPQAGGEGLFELHLRAEKEAGKEKPSVTEHFMHIEANPHISDEAKYALLEKLTDPEEKRVRWDGQFAGSQLHIFPEWNEHVHVGVLTNEGWKKHGETSEPSLPIPKDWTRYMVVDPGHAVCAVLFAAVPPKSFGDYVYLYDELYIQPCLSADHFGKMVAARIGDDHFYEFLVDGKNARQTEVASGRTIGDQYAEALENHKVRSQQTGSTLLWAMVDAQSGNMAVHDWLHTRTSTGDAKLRVIKGHCPNFVFEIQRYRKKRAPDGTITDKPYEKHDHLMTCLKYLRWRNPKWHEPVKRRTKKKRDGLDVLNDLKKREKQRYGNQSSFVNLGPGKGRSRERNYA